MWGTLRNTAPFIRSLRHAGRRRLYSRPPGRAQKDPSAVKDQAPASSQQTANPTIERVQSRLPKFLRPYTEGLRNAPVSHITSFLVLHELTALVPLVGLGAYFYQQDQLPWFAEGRWFNDGVQKFGNHFRKKGWLGDDAQLGEDGKEIAASRRWKWWGRSENGVKLVTSVAAAYALTKIFLPLRLIVSVWMTPLFARTTIIPITRSFTGLFRRKKG